MKWQKKFLSVLIFLLIFLLILFTISIFWTMKTFNDVGFEQILFHFLIPMEGTDVGMIKDFINSSLIPSILIYLLFMLFYFILKNSKIIISFNHKNLKRKMSIQLTSILMIITICLSLGNSAKGFSMLGVPEFIRNSREKSSIFETNYKDPKHVEISILKKKRNLIYIYLESMETSYLSYDLGGCQEENLIPNLTKLAENNISFSSTEGFNGAFSAPGTQWTVAAIVAQTAGIPLKVPIDGNEYSGYDSFLPGAWSLGDILYSQGYNQEFFCGSDATFGGRADYFNSHGKYKIWDYYTAIKEKKISNDYRQWWGFEDEKLFKFAKEEIINLSQKKEPFNFTMLTADTHHIGGYVCELCEDDFEDQYANVIACSDRQVQKFVEWIEEQEFYENTTIVISGDHNSMDPYFFENILENYERNTFNVIINSPIEPVQMKNRIFSSFDMYPTTLASLGFSIKGDKLGLGVNLFSKEKSLVEVLGKTVFSEELNKNSKLYNKEILYHKNIK